MASASVNFRALPWLCCVLALINLTKCDRVKNKIYQDIQGDMACFKRFNGTQEIGCTSKFHGNSGVIHVVKNESDLSWVYDKGPHQPYVLALPPQFFTAEVLEQAKQSGKVSGVVVMVQENFTPESALSGFSGESHCPNEELGLYNSTYPEYANYCRKKPWNPKGSSLLYMSWNFPIFLLTNQTSIDYITKYFGEFNKPGNNGEPRSWPLLCMELKSNMFGTTNTEVCMRRRSLASSFMQPVNFCDPLADSNIWGTLKPMNSSQQVPEKSVTIVATRMDAASMFDNISPGANSAVSGLVTLMVAADALNKYKDAAVADSHRNVLFVIYQGETWGYIGSSRMVWDMERGEFPFRPQKDEIDQMSQINLTHIEQFIEIEQVGQGMQPDGSYLFFHTDPVSNSDPQIKDETEKLLTLLENSSVSITFDRAGNDKPLPPASFQSFLKKVNISGVVITDHMEGFKNNFYESVLDDAQNVKYNYTQDNSNKYPKHISNIASTLASALYKHITGITKTIPVNEKLTNSLFHCYMQNVSCPMFRTYGERVPKSFFEDKPAKMYVSVKGGEDMRTYISKSIFATLLGDQVPLNKSLCKIESFYHVTQLYYFSSVDNGTCYRSTVRQTEAMSPAFLIENYDWQSGEYSTWTESGWQLTKLMIYLKPSVGEEVGLMCGGIASFLLSFGVVYFFNSRANIIFAVTTPPVAC